VLYHSLCLNSLLHNLSAAAADGEIRYCITNSTRKHTQLKRKLVRSLPHTDMKNSKLRVYYVTSIEVHCTRRVLQCCLPQLPGRICFVVAWIPVRWKRLWRVLVGGLRRKMYKAYIKVCCAVRGGGVWVMGDRSSAGSGIQYPRFSLRVRTIKSHRLVEERYVDFLSE